MEGNKHPESQCNISICNSNLGAGVNQSINRNNDQDFVAHILKYLQLEHSNIFLLITLIPETHVCMWSLL